MRGPFVTGTGGVGPLGTGIVWPPPGPISNEPRVPADLPLREGFPPQSTRWLDGASLWWAHAARQALAHLLPGEIPASGQAVGQSWGPTAPVVALERGIWSEGPGAMNPALFPFTAGNAPAGQASLLLGLTGPSLTLLAKEASGLAALVEASRLMACGAAVTMVAGGTDELDPLLLQVLKPLRGRGARPPGEGAYALLLERDPGPRRPLARVAGWGGTARPCEPHVFPVDAGALLDDLAAAVGRSAGWGPSSADVVALPADTPFWEREAEEWRRWRAPGAEALLFQGPLGCSGAAWAGAAAILAERAARNEAGRCLLLAVSSGGAGWGLALEALP
ncbi:MAG: beta-ketoacyl synthase N-terminal-like domain-containing protein [Acidobacteriota bacterium]